MEGDGPDIPLDAPPPPWWPPRGTKEWEIAEPCSTPPPELWDKQTLLGAVPPPCWPAAEEEALVLSGEFMRQLALSEKKRKERRRKEKDSGGEASQGKGKATPQGLLEERRRFERSDALGDILKGRQEVRDFREATYGEGLSAITDMEDRLNEAYDALCSASRAPIWPTPPM
ncbi:hypothetical protein HOP50_11g62750 [Chloropicon primus]|nr:hypothetical protein HOP50_11g62750 [Chloropicon primus]